MTCNFADRYTYCLSDRFSATAAVAAAARTRADLPTRSSAWTRSPLNLNYYQFDFWSNLARPDYEYVTSFRPVFVDIVKMMFRIFVLVQLNS